MAIDLTITAPDVTAPDVAARSARHRFVFLRNAKALAGLIILGFFTLIAIIGPWIAPYSPSKLGPELMAPPSAAHWLGTTNLGQDILSQLLVGTRGVMIVGFAAGIVATLLAIIIGVTSGYAGGIVDEFLSALANIFLVIPALPLIIIITGQLPHGGEVVISLVIAITGWAWGSRILRAQTLSLRKRDFVEASRANGESIFRIVGFEILPNLTAIIASSFVGTVTFAILSQITLAFIGVTSISEWNWGTILFWAQSNQALARGAWWWFVPAGLCIAMLGMALALINFGIDEFVNPRLRSTGQNAKAMRRRGIVARIGFTPVVRIGSAGPTTPTRPSTPTSRSTPARPSTPTRRSTPTRPSTPAAKKDPK